MILCRVTGTVTAPQKDEHLARNKLLICQPIGLDGEDQGQAMLSLDAAQAGPGDVVLVLNEGSSVRLMFGDEKVPLNTVVIAVVDGIHIEWREGESVAERTEQD